MSRSSSAGVEPGSSRLRVHSGKIVLISAKQYAKPRMITIYDLTTEAFGAPYVGRNYPELRRFKLAAQQTTEPPPDPCS